MEEDQKLWKRAEEAGQGLESNSMLQVLMECVQGKLILSEAKQIVTNYRNTN